MDSVRPDAQPPRAAQTVPARRGACHACHLRVPLYGAGIRLAHCKFLVRDGALTLSATAYTVFAIPYVSMPAEMSEDSNERSRIVSTGWHLRWRAPSSARPARLGWCRLSRRRHGYARMSLVVADLLCSDAVRVLRNPTRALNESIVTEAGFLRQLIDTLGNAHFRALAFVYLTQSWVSVPWSPQRRIMQATSRARERAGGRDVFVMME